MVIQSSGVAVARLPSRSRLQQAPQACRQRTGGEICSPDIANHPCPICFLGVQAESRSKLKRPPHLGGGRTSARLSRAYDTRCSASLSATILYSFPPSMSIVDSRSHDPCEPRGEKPALPLSKIRRSIRRQKPIAEASVVLRPRSSPSGTSSIPDQMGAHDQRSKQREW